MSKLELLKKQVLNKINNSECKICSINGVNNLSKCDLEDIVLYIDNYLKYNDFTAYNQFMQPMGNIKELLYKYI